MFAFFGERLRFWIFVAWSFPNQVTDGILLNFIWNACAIFGAKLFLCGAWSNFGTRHCFRIIFSGFSFFCAPFVVFFLTYKCVIMNHTQSSCFAIVVPVTFGCFVSSGHFFSFMSILEKTERNKKMQMSQGWVKALVNMPLVVTFAFTANCKCFCTTVSYVHVPWTHEISLPESWVFSLKSDFKNLAGAQASHIESVPSLRCAGS